MSTTRRAYFAWAVVCVVWGTTYLAIRVALESIPPMVMAGMRWTSAGALLVGGLKLKGERLPGPRAWGALAILGVLLLGFGNGAVVWAEQTVSSGMAAVLVASVPFWMVAIEAFVPPAAPTVGVSDTGARHRGQTQVSDTRPAWRAGRTAAGLILGFAGIVMLVWPEIHVGENRRGFLIGLASTQIACLGWALGSSYSRRRGHTEAHDENVLATAAFEMLFGGLALLAVGSVLGEWARLSFTLRTSLALAHLIFFGSIAGFTAYAYALKHLSVATASLYAYVNPVIAVILGALILGETLNVRMAVAAAIVLVGVALVRE